MSWVALSIGAALLAVTIVDVLVPCPSRCAIGERVVCLEWETGDCQHQRGCACVHLGCTP